MKKLVLLTALLSALLFFAYPAKAQYHKTVTRKYHKTHKVVTRKPQIVYRDARPKPKVVKGREARMEMQERQGAVHEQQEKKVEAVQRKLKEEEVHH